MSQDEDVEYPRVVPKMERETLVHSKGKLHLDWEYEYDTPEQFENNDPADMWVYLSSWKGNEQFLLGMESAKQLIYRVAPVVDISVTNTVDDEVQCPKGHWTVPSATVEGDEVVLRCSDTNFSYDGEPCGEIIVRAVLDEE